MSKINPPKVFGSESLDDAIKLFKDLKSGPRKIWEPELDPESMNKPAEIASKIDDWFDAQFCKLSNGYKQFNKDLNKLTHKALEWLFPFDIDLNKLTDKALEWLIPLLLMLTYIIAFGWGIFVYGGIFKILLHAWRAY